MKVLMRVSQFSRMNFLHGTATGVKAGALSLSHPAFIRGSL